jgi:carbamoyl-phosphate synthase large subunit
MVMVMDRLSHLGRIAPQKPSGRPRVLVTGTGEPSGIAVMKALSGEKLEIYMADVDPRAPGLSSLEGDRGLLIPRRGGDSWTELVYSFCERHRIDILIPTVDCELLLLASARVFFADIGTKIVLASEKTLRMCLDKWALHRHCKEAVRMPDSTLADEAFDPFRPELPVVVKPRMSTRSRRIQLIERREDLEQIDRDGSLIVQEYLPGVGYSLDTLARSDGQVIAVMPWERSRVGSGLVATGSTVCDERLEATGRRIAERIGLTSVASIQVKEDSDGEPALLEVNPCFLGTMPLTIASGVNMPKFCVDEALDLPLPEDIVPIEQLALIRNPHFDSTAEGVANG